MMGRRAAAVLVGLMCLAGSAVACSPDNPLNQLLGKSGLTCVDAVGANSTPEQIADAQLNTEFTDPTTGETKRGWKRLWRWPAR